MADAASSPLTATAAKGGRRPLAMIAVTAAFLAGGFASTYFDIWSPMSLLSKDHATSAEAPLPAVEFVPLPQIVLSLAGPQMRTLVMSIQVETTAQQMPQIRLLLPRLSDAFNGFLAEIDPLAFEKRGILEVVRDELATRAIHVLGKDAFSDILITEFRIQ